MRNQGLAFESRNRLDDGRDQWRTYPKARLHWPDVDASPDAKKLAALHEPRQRLIDGSTASKVKEPLGRKGRALGKFLGSLKNGLGHGPDPT